VDCYFLHIGYFPELAFNDALLLFSAGIILALFIIILLLCLIVAPCFIWDAGISGINGIKELSYEEKTKIVFGFFILPSIILISYFYCFEYTNTNIYILISIAYLIILYRYDKTIKTFISILIFWIVGTFCFCYSLIPFIALINNEKLLRSSNPIEQHITLIVFLLLIVLANGLILLKPEKLELNKTVWIIIVSFATFILMTFLLRAWDFIPKLVISKLKLGNVENAVLLVNEEGCKIFRFYDLPILEGKKDNVCSNKNKINILLRIGENCYIEGINEENSSIRFMLPRKTVMY